jgi:zeta-carotene desaturase
MLAWLQKHRQTVRAIRRFWEVILVSALDEELDRIDARYGIDVFWKAFLSTRGGYRVGIPRVPLGELYEGCRKALGAQGGEVQLRAGVRGFLVVDGRVEGIEREDGSVETADYYLAAVPQDVLPELLPAEVVEREPVFLNLRNLTASPITGVHLWFDRTVMTEPFLTLLDSTTQWVFNKTQLYGVAEGSGQYLQLVISASYSLASRPRQEIIAQCLEELRNVLPATREATLLKGTVVKEMSATFSPVPADRKAVVAKAPSRDYFSLGTGHIPAGRPQWREPYAPATWPPKQFSPMPECHGNCCSRICVRKVLRACGRAHRNQQAANCFDLQSTIIY